jgi:hypothetical protein
LQPARRNDRYSLRNQEDQWSLNLSIRGDGHD